MNYIPRPKYIEFLQRHREKNIIKVLSGVRRAGKSVIFSLFKQELMKDDIKEEQIISINFEDLSYYELRDYQKLYHYLLNKINQETQIIFSWMKSNTSHNLN